MGAEFERDPEFDDVPSKSRPTRGFTVVMSLVDLAVIVSKVVGVLGVVMILIAVFTAPAAHRAVMEEVRRRQCVGNLKQIALAIHHYKQDYNCFPPAFTVDAEGKRLHSWRTLILPYLEEVALYQSIDLSKPWNDPANARALATPPLVYRCPDSSNRSPTNCTSYLAVVAPDGCFHSDPTHPRRLKEITDDPRYTLMAAEAGGPCAVPWMAPVDADEALILRLAKDWAPPHGEGRAACFADGSARFLKSDVSAETLRALTSIAGGEEPPLIEGW